MECRHGLHEFWHKAELWKGEIWFALLRVCVFVLCMRTLAECIEISILICALVIVTPGASVAQVWSLLVLEC